MKVCPECKREVERLNRKGMCDVCGEKRMLDAITQVRARKGPYYDKMVKNIREAAKRRREGHG